MLPACVGIPQKTKVGRKTISEKNIEGFAPEHVSANHNDNTDTTRLQGHCRAEGRSDGVKAVGVSAQHIKETGNSTTYNKQIANPTSPDAEETVNFITHHGKETANPTVPHVKKALSLSARNVTSFSERWKRRCGLHKLIKHEETFDPFDPFQVFKVEHEDCLDLKIDIHKGEHITKGSSLADFMDTPDPYVVLRIPGSSNSSRRTSHLDNCTTPLWNETFHFYLDPSNEYTLHVTLRDANYTLDETLGEDTFPLSLLTLDEPVDHVFHILPGGSKIYATFLLQKNKNPDLRFSVTLCDQEREFLKKRRLKVLLAMKKLLGKQAPQIDKQVPIVAVLGSGGGFRAMSCLSGAVKALNESGVLDCATYIAGLSGSSWYISNLYAHGTFQNVTPGQIHSELQDAVTHDWKWKLSGSLGYIARMVTKYRNGQPVSFTDFFGHLLGDVLLKDFKESRLSDQRRILQKGLVPFPLYTCLHAKRSVTCRTFSEWMEFSPYEIGIPKYATFMKPEHFGSKFIVGKLVKQYEEFPLHYLQGVWGSAFTILVKRLVQSGTTDKDLVQIMRDNARDERAFNEQYEEESKDQYSESDTENEDDIVGSDDEDDLKSETIVEEEIDAVSAEKEANTRHRGLAADSAESRSPTPPKKGFRMKKKSPIRNSKETEENKPTASTKTSEDATSKLAEILPENSSVDQSDESISSAKKYSLDETANSKSTKEKNTSIASSMKKALSFEAPRKISLGNLKILSKSEQGSALVTKVDGDKKLLRKGAVRSPMIKRQRNVGENAAPNKWRERRETLRDKKVQKKLGVMDGLKQSVMTGTNLLNSRAGRAGEILNPFRGLSLKNSFPISPFAESFQEEQEEDTVDNTTIGAPCRYQPLDNSAKKLFVVDSGLAFNSPYPVLLRPQRAVDIYLSFDFSMRETDRTPPFQELILAEKWAIQNKVPFPPIQKQTEQYKAEEVPREVYIFKDANNSSCPVILHFPLVNNHFRKFKAPGVERKTKEEKEFADFKIFDHPDKIFSSMNFVYDKIQFERLVRLIEFNTLYCMDIIKEELALIVKKKQQMLKPHVTLNQVVALLKRVQSAKTHSRNSLRDESRVSDKTQTEKSELQLRISADNERHLINMIKQNRSQLQRQSTRDGSTSDSEFFDAIEDYDDEDDTE